MRNLGALLAQLKPEFTYLSINTGTQKFLLPNKFFVIDVIKRQAIRNDIISFMQGFMREPNFFGFI